MPVLAFIFLLMMLGFHYIKHCLPFFTVFYRRLMDKPETTTTANCHGGCHKAHLKVDAGHRLVCFITDPSQRNKPDRFFLSQMFLLR